MSKKYLHKVLPPALFLTLGGTTCEQTAAELTADFSAPQAIALVCLQRIDSGEIGGTICPEDLDANGNIQAEEFAFDVIPLEGCDLVNEEDISEENETNTVVPNSFLFALVANTSRGDISALSLSGGVRVIDSDNATPGVNYMPVGTFPSAIAVDDNNGRYVTTNAGSNDLSVFDNADLIRCFSNRLAAPTIPLGGSPRDAAFDDNGVVYVTIPERGEVVAVDFTQATPVITRADVTQGAAGPMRPTRIAISDSRRVAYITNAAGNEMVELDLESMVEGNTPIFTFIDVQSRTGAIDYLEASTLSFEGALDEGQDLPDPIDIPETLYVGSLDFTGQVLVVDVATRSLVNLRPNDAQSFGPGIRIGAAAQTLDPVVDIDFFIEPLLPVVETAGEPFFLARQDKPNNLQGAFALVTTADAEIFVVNVAPNEPGRRCCTVDGDPNFCEGGSIPPDDEGNCPEGVFLPEQAPHTVRNITLEDEPRISLDPALFVGQSRINLASSAVQRFPAIGNDDGCFGGEGDCGFDVTLDPKIVLPPKSKDVFNEAWALIFEGVIPGSLRANGSLVADTLFDDAAYCARGIFPGDILQILTPQLQDAPAECALFPTPAAVNSNGAFDVRGSPFDDDVTAELTVLEVFQDRIVFDLSAAPAGFDLASCYSGAVRYRLRVNDAFLVTGQEDQHSFLHRQVANPDGTCAEDASIDPLFDARAIPGAVFNNIVFSIDISNPEPPVNGQGVVATFRDVAWQFSISSGFAPWGIDPDTSRNTGESNIPGGVVVTPDGTSAFMTDSNHDRVYEFSIPGKSVNIDFTF
jgi:DNA-binding beta-propeller fold protein YncE